MHKLPPPTIEISKLIYLGYFNGHSLYLDSQDKNKCKYVCHCNNTWFRGTRISDLLSLPADNKPTNQVHLLRCLISSTRYTIEHCTLASNEIHKALLHLLTALQNEARR